MQFRRGLSLGQDRGMFLAFGSVLQFSGDVGGDIEVLEIVLENFFFRGKRHPRPRQRAVYCGTFLFSPLPQGFDRFFFSC